MALNGLLPLRWKTATFTKTIISFLPLTVAFAPSYLIKPTLRVYVFVCFWTAAPTIPRWHGQWPIWTTANPQAIIQKQIHTTDVCACLCSSLTGKGIAVRLSLSRLSQKFPSKHRPDPTRLLKSGEIQVGRGLPFTLNLSTNSGFGVCCFVCLF